MTICTIKSLFFGCESTKHVYDVQLGRVLWPFKSCGQCSRAAQIV